MRDISGSDLKLTSRRDRVEYLRVRTLNADTDEVDLTDLLGRDFIDDVQVGTWIDQPVSEARITFAREVDYFSLVPFHGNSKLNAVGPLLREGRPLWVDAAWAPAGTPRAALDAAGAWRCIFDGLIDDLDWAAPKATLTARDKASVLQDAFIEREMVYGLWPTGNGLLVWAPALEVRVGDWIMPSTGPDGSTPYGYTCTVAGTTGTSEPGDNGNPAWPIVPAHTVTDGSVTWRCEGAQTATGVAVETVMQKIIDQNIGAGVVSLVTPVSPAWAIKGFRVDRTSILEVLRNLANQIGWDVRLLWNQAWSRWDLTFYQPDRTPSLTDWTFGAADYTDVRKASTSRSGIRNVIEVVFSDSSDVDISGLPKRKRYQWKDDASVADYGRRYMEISEAYSSLIDTPAEAQRLAESCGQDLAAPPFEFDVELPLWWAMEMGDYLKFSANGVHFTVDQSLGVVGFTHRFTPSGSTTTIQTRGKPCAAFGEWHEKGAGRGTGQADKNGSVHAPPVTGGGITLTPSTRGVKVRTKPPKGLGKWRETEVHASTTSGFTPSAATLVARGAQEDFFIGGLATSVPQYFRLINIDADGHRSAPSVEVSSAAAEILEADIRPALLDVASVTLSHAQVTESGSEKVAFDSALLDKGDGFDALDKAYYAQSDGVYRVRAELALSGLYTGDMAGLVIKVNDTTVATGPKYFGGEECAAGLERVLELVRGDKVEVFLACTTGGTPTIGTDSVLEVQRLLSAP